MKLTKLLTGAAVAALISGAAHAAPPVTVDGSGTDIDAQVRLASELVLSKLPTANKTGVLDLDFSLIAANVPGSVDLFANTSPADVIELTITLTGMEFNGGINSGDFNGTATPAPAVVSGGADGDTTVVYEFGGSAGNPADYDAAGQLAFVLPVELTAMQANFSVSIRNKTTDTALLSFTYDSDTNTAGQQNLVDTVDGYNIAVDLANAYTSATSAALGGTNANTRVAVGPAAGVLYNSLETGGGFDNILGLITATVNAAAQEDLNGTAFNPFSGTRVSDVDLVLTVADGSAFAGATFDGSITVTGATTGTAAGGLTTRGFLNAAGTAEDNTAEVNLAFADIAAADFGNGASVQVALVDEAATDFAAIVEQTPSLSVTIDAAAAAPFEDQTFNFNLEQVERAGATGAAFAWVGDASAVTRNIIRCTGVSSSATAIADVSGSSTGLNGSYELSNTATNGEMIITNAQLGAAAGDFGRANVTIRFAGDTTNNTCQRLLVGSNGTLSELD